MKPLNVVIKGFVVKSAAQILEKAFEDIPLGYCMTVLDKDADRPNLKAEEHVSLYSPKLRMIDMEGGYDIDWNTIRPLDEKLIYDMRECEAIVLDMFSRYERNTTISYEQRKRAYLQHLRYWNHILEEKKIDLCIISHIPHNCFDNVLYRLCKLKGIPTTLFYYGIVPDALMYMTDWEESAIEVRDRYKELQSEHPNGSLDIQLSKECQEYFEKQTDSSRDSAPWYMDMVPSHPSKRSVGSWIGIGMSLGFKKPVQFLSHICSHTFWQQKLRQSRAFRFYESHCTEPDLNKKYVYVALQSQPECSTSPMAGAFVDQLLTVQLLSACLPEDVHLYVKEHPHQGGRCRSVEYYKDFLAVDRVQLVSRSFSTYHLIEHATAVSTATGTVGFEALFREKPVFLFGHRFFQYAPGVYPIHSEEDCKKAVEEIYNKGKRPRLADVRLFFKAFDDVKVLGHVVTICEAATNITPEENAQSVGAFLSQKIREIVQS